MTYEETLHYLFHSMPVFEHSGASAYKPGLDTSRALDAYFGHPHTTYKTIHVAGTNGKGSVCHLLAAVLQLSGYKVGLFTSPHLVDFRERIRVDGQMVPKEYVVDFVEQHKAFFEPLHPSFFELTSTMAFEYFRRESVDIAIIEVGLGGRLDSTNIITPILSIITNISMDHTQFLGDTPAKIAAEKAGIIKPGVPVVIGDMRDKTVAEVFTWTAEAMGAPLYYARKEPVVTGEMYIPENREWMYETADYGIIFGALGGHMQNDNARTVFCALRRLSGMGLAITQRAVWDGFQFVVRLTGLRGRWEEFFDRPLIIMDTGHNLAAWEYLGAQIQIESQSMDGLYMILGFSNDKDIDGILQEIPKRAKCIFTQASTDRAVPAGVLAAKGKAIGLDCVAIESLEDALDSVMNKTLDNYMIFIGGSSFIVADSLPFFDE